jgi:single-strand DNA-binding protein
MNLLINTGRLGKDARTFQTQNGTPAVSFNLAVDIGYGENKKTEWRSCTFFGKRAEAVAPYLVKGQAVAVAGTPKMDSYQDKDGNTKYFIAITVSDLDLIGSPTGQGQERSQTTAEKPSRPSKPTAAAPLDDDMPF